MFEKLNEKELELFRNSIEQNNQTKHFIVINNYAILSCLDNSEEKHNKYCNVIENGYVIKEVLDHMCISHVELKKSIDIYYLKFYYFIFDLHSGNKIKKNEPYTHESFKAAFFSENVAGIVNQSNGIKSDIVLNTSFDDLNYLPKRLGSLMLQIQHLITM